MTGTNMWRLAVIVATKLFGGGRVGMRGRQRGDAHERVRLGSTEVGVREIHGASRRGYGQKDSTENCCEGFMMSYQRRYWLCSG